MRARGKTPQERRKWRQMGEWFIARYMPDGDCLYLGTVNQKLIAILSVHRKGLRLYVRDRRKHRDSLKARTYIIPGQYGRREVVEFLIEKTGVSKGARKLDKPVINWRSAEGRRRAAAQAAGAAGGVFEQSDYGTQSVATLLRYRDLMRLLKESGIWQRRGRLDWPVPAAFFRVVPLAEFVRGCTASPRAWWARYIARRLNTHLGDQMARSFCGTARIAGLEEARANELLALIAAARAARVRAERAFAMILRLTTLEDRLCERASKQQYTLHEKAAGARSSIARSVLARRASRGEQTFSERCKAISGWMRANKHAIERKKRDIANRLLLPARRDVAFAQYRVAKALIENGILPETPMVIKKWIPLGMGSRSDFIADLLFAIERSWVESPSWGIYASQLHAAYRNILFAWHQAWCEQGGVAFETLVQTLLPLQSKAAARALHAAIKEGLPSNLFVKLGARSAADIEFAAECFGEARRAGAHAGAVAAVTPAYRPPSLALPEGWAWADHKSFYRLSREFHNCISEQAYYGQQIARGRAHVVYRPDDRRALAFIEFEEFEVGKLDRQTEVASGCWYAREMAGIANAKVSAKYRTEAEGIAGRLTASMPHASAPLPAPMAEGRGVQYQRLLAGAATTRRRQMVVAILAHLGVRVDADVAA